MAVQTSRFSRIESLPAPVRSRLGGISALRWQGSSETIPIIFLHGIGSAAESWTSLVEALEETATILAWDMPGYGASEDLAVSNPRSGDYANALAHMLDRAEIQRAIIVGHSLGALIGGRFAATWPERTAALALLSPALGYQVPEGEPLPEKVQARINDLEALGPERFAAARAASLVFDPMANPALVTRILESMAGVRQPGYGNAVNALASGDLLADARNITARAMIANGANDIITPPNGARLVHESLRYAETFLEIPETGHALPQQAPKQTAHALRDFFARIRERPS